MRLLSLDMSTKKTGWAIFSDEKLEDFGLIECDAENVDDRVKRMFVGIRELVSSRNIDFIVCEDVPVSQHSNLKVGKDLCTLQGCFLALAEMYGLQHNRRGPNEWRTELGLNHTDYKCKKCGCHFEDISALKNIICPNCNNNAKTTFEKTALNERDQLKKRAVDMANKNFGLDLKYVNKTSKLNEDDMAEAILIGLSQLKKIEEEDYGREN